MFASDSKICSSGGNFCRKRQLKNTELFYLLDISSASQPIVLKASADPLLVPPNFLHPLNISEQVGSTQVRLQSVKRYGGQGHQNGKVGPAAT
jgi:hypothetical protein